MQDVQEINVLKLINIFKKIIGFLIFVFCTAAICHVLYNCLPIFSNYERFVIMSDSMSPTIKVGDVVTINKKILLSELKVGDIIAFYQDVNFDEEDEIIVHYIADIDLNEQDEFVFLTRRKNAINPSSWDSWQLKENDIIGKYVRNVPLIGKFLLFLSSSFGKFVIIFNAIVLYIIIKLIDEDIKKESKQ